MRSRRVVGVILLVAACIVLLLRFSGAVRERGEWEKKVGTELRVEGEVFGDPEYEAGEWKFRVKKVREVGEETSLTRGMIYVTSYTEHKIRRGARLILYGKMTEGFGTYSGTFYRARIEKIIEANESGVRARILEFREKLAERIEKNIPGESEGKLGLAYLLGLKGGLNEVTEKNLRAVGLTQLVVASGMHLGIICEIVKKLFGKISRFSGLFVSLLFVIGFGEMIGWTPSITRAAVATIIGLSAWYYGVELAKIKVVGFAVWLSLMIEPGYLYDMGWQLSFLAYFGVLVVAPRVSEFLYPRRETSKELKGLWPKPSSLSDMLIVSFATVFCVAPLLIYNFGFISLASIIGNLLIAPSLAIVMGLSLLAGLAGPIGAASGMVAGKILELHLIIVQFLAEKEFFLIYFPAGDKRIFYLYIPLVSWLILDNIFIWRKRKRISKLIREHPEKYLRWKLVKTKR